MCTADVKWWLWSGLCWKFLTFNASFPPFTTSYGEKYMMLVECNPFAFFQAQLNYRLRLNEAGSTSKLLELVI